MQSADLAKLYRLHRVDAQISEIRKRAAALDPGRAEERHYRSAEEEYGKSAAALAALRAELTDLELEQKALEEKIGKFDKELYGGKIVNPKEIETIQKEISLLKDRRPAMDEKILLLWEKIPEAEKAHAVSEENLNSAKKLLQGAQRRALEAKSQMETQFKELTTQRPQALQGIDEGLLKRYEEVRKRTGDVAMAEIGPKGNCSRCGTVLPERIVQSVKEDRWTLCENCHRILFAPVPAA